MRLLPTGAGDDALPKVEVVGLWLIVAVAVGIIFWNRLGESFASTDNAMRLVEVRAFLDGAPWFDPHESRFAPPFGYDTHWSRLIDAGIAGLILVFRQVVAPDLAERLARCIWPLLVSGPAIFAVIAIAVRLGGTGAGRAALLAALPTLALLPVFHPGEIDHHNVQIMLSLVLMACAMWCERPYAASAAGVAGGMLLSVGLEASHVLICVAGVLALLLAFDASWKRPVRAFGLALAASTAGFYLAVTPGAFRFSPQCDALAINSAVAVVTGGVGLAIVAAFADRWATRGRLLALAIAGAAAGGAYCAIEPRCLSGPFGLIDRTIFPLWLNKVQEMQPLSTLFRTEGLQAIVYIGFPAVAALCVLFVVRRGLRTPVAWALIAAFGVSSLIMIGQVRMIVYAIWLGLPIVGAAAQFLGERTTRVSLVRIFAAALASPPFISVAAAELTSSHSKDHERAEADIKTILECFQPDKLHALAALPTGLVLGPLDLGPAMLAHTGQSVVAAPYHRADRAIRFNQEVMDGPNAAAQRRVLDRGVDYVVTCTGYERHVTAGSFHEALLAGKIGPWLEPVPTRESDLVKIWRVIR